MKGAPSRLVVISILPADFTDPGRGSTVGTPTSVHQLKEEIAVFFVPATLHFKQSIFFARESAQEKAAKEDSSAN